MKKAINIILSALVVFSLFTGCQHTPEAPIVVQKDADTFIEKAQAGPETANPDQFPSLRAQTGAAEWVEYSETALDGRLAIQVNAPVILPDAAAMPVLRVKAVDFSEEIAKAFFDKLCGDDVMMDASIRRTEGEIEKEILENEKLKMSEEYMDDPVGQKQFDLINAELKKQYLTAPESKDPFQVDGSFYSIPVIDPRNKIVGSYMGIEARSEKRHFRVENNNGLTEPIIYEYDGGWSGLGAGSLAQLHYYAFAHMETEGIWWRSPGQLIKDENAAPAEAYGQLAYTPAEARAMAEELLKETGMEVHRMYLECDYDAFNPELETRTVETANYGYTLECLRKVDGVPCAADSGVSTGEQPDRYAPQWPYETMSIFITNDGIQSVIWSSPIEVTDTVVEQAKLLPFEDVMDIFKKMTPIVYTPNTQNEAGQFMDNLIEQYGITVEEIRLELRRVREQNSVTDGLLIPVWSFYGNQWQTKKDGSEPEITGTEGSQTCLLTINAVDGSIIDLAKGY